MNDKRRQNGVTKGVKGSESDSGADNVIYANFGARKRVEKASDLHETAQHMQRLRPLQGSAGLELRRMILENADKARYQRGIDYARSGHVVEIDIHNGAAHGKVAGSQNQPFSVLIQLPPRSVSELNSVGRMLAETSGAMERVRAGELADDVLEVLLAEDDSDIRCYCDCPDSAWICKHLVAFAEALSGKLDADPAAVFHLRGISLRQLEEMIVASAQDVARKATEDGAETFWSGRELPAVPSPKIAPALDDSDPDLLRKALRAVSHTNIDLLRAVSDIEDMYHHLTHRKQ
ncbi:SWIM zinc finger family protein [Corynebacterium propinquum]|uniref:SWIM zinc finger family protein n=1 Tax=Corynebacterium propinquum TaxID=43769 RepID=UPI002540EA22|nr:SWIM zinc finger family protein [Corynebacterium propinquum]MDK4257147.1 SWIM zinc finger family protein [Corynebacterium propinquum]MDK4281410.1 SWIM zinc finger family protein [Corynebacterium propinquum]MDK4298044.1 SWIM zinc finger family protein [Corynebacterium propinquum]